MLAIDRKGGIQLFLGTALYDPVGLFHLAGNSKDLNLATDSDVLCGVNGFNYQNFVLPREPSLTLNSVQQALNMLQKSVVIGS